jgi:hypothetical protein
MPELLAPLVDLKTKALGILNEVSVIAVGRWRLL